MKCLDVKGLPIADITWEKRIIGYLWLKDIENIIERDCMKISVKHHSTVDWENKTLLISGLPSSFDGKSEKHINDYIENVGRERVISKIEKGIYSYCKVDDDDDDDVEKYLQKLDKEMSQYEEDK